MKRAVIIVVVLAVLAFLFIRTIRNTNSEPYTASAAAMTGWTVAAVQPGDRDVPGVVVLVPPAQLSPALFRQVFQRTMQSLIAPSPAAVPLVLQGEYDDSLQGVHSVDNIVSIARDAGLESARFQPLCMGERTQSVPGRTAQLFFVVFDSPAFDRFRSNLMPTQPEHGGTGRPFEPAALRPILVVASTDREFRGWWPIAFSQNDDCKAPVDLQ